MLMPKKLSETMGIKYHTFVIRPGKARKELVLYKPWLKFILFWNNNIYFSAFSAFIVEQQTFTYCRTPISMRSYFCESTILNDYIFFVIIIFINLNPNARNSLQNMNCVTCCIIITDNFHHNLITALLVQQEAQRATVAHLSTINASKIWLRNGTKNNNTSFYMFQDHCYALGLLL